MKDPLVFELFPMSMPCKNDDDQPKLDDDVEEGKKMSVLEVQIAKLEAKIA